MKKMVGQVLCLPNFPRGASTANTCVAPMGTTGDLFRHDCVEDRQSVLANDKAFNAFKTAIGKLQHWRVLAATVMPDHLHASVAPLQFHNRPQTGDASLIAPIS
jgi:hypothetical protein